MKLEIGGGRRVRTGWLAYDINPRHGDVVGDAHHLPFRDESIQEISAIDVLEHISYRDTQATLNEWARVCAPMAGLYVQVPDLNEIVMRYQSHQLARLNTPDDLESTLLMGLQWRLLGGHADGLYVEDDAEWRWNAHYSLWTKDELTRQLNRAGFFLTQIATNQHPNICARAVRRHL